MTIDAQHPVNVRRDLRCDVLDGNRERGDLVLTGGLQIGAAKRKQDLALQYEAIADDLNAGSVGQHVTQLAKEFASITLQLLYLGRQRHV